MAPVKEIPAKLVAELRARTGAGIMDCKRALEETGGDLDKAVELLRSKSMAKADKRASHQAAEGLIDAYVHFNGRVAVLIELNCETDFVARTDAFRQLTRDLALHVASQAPIAVRIEDVPGPVIDSERRIYEAQVAEQKKPENLRAKIVEGMLRKFYEERVLYEQKFVKDDTRTVGELVRGLAAQTGENIQVRRFARFELGAD